MSRVTASKVSLLADCGYSFRDDAIQDPWRDSPSAARGTAIHEAIDDFISTGRYQPPPEVVDEVAAAVAWLHEQRWERTELSSEVAFGWAPETDTAEIYDVTGRGYPRDGKLHGTADIIVRTDAGVFVGDWKSGDGSSAGPQLRTLGLMAARAYGLDEITVAALEVKAWGVTEVCRETLDSFALSALAGELADQIASVPNAEPRAGAHCSEKYCNSRLSCPLGNAATAELVDVIPTDALTRSKPFKLTDPIRTPEHAAWALDVLRLVSAKVDALKDEIKSRVPAEGWMLDDGRVLKETHSTVTYVDKDRAFALAKKLGASPQQLDDCTRSFPRSNGVRLSGGTTKHRTRKTKVA